MTRVGVASEGSRKETFARDTLAHRLLAPRRRAQPARECGPAAEIATDQRANPGGHGEATAGALSKRPAGLRGVRPLPRQHASTLPLTLTTYLTFTLTTYPYYVPYLSPLLRTLITYPNPLPLPLPA